MDSSSRLFSALAVMVCREACLLWPSGAFRYLHQFPSCHDYVHLFQTINFILALNILLTNNLQILTGIRRPIL
jgi:hypothetical protein